MKNLKAILISFAELMCSKNPIYLSTQGNNEYYRINGKTYFINLKHKK